MKTFLKTLFVAVLFFVVAESQAQISVGGGLWYGSDISSVGISANGKYAINEDWAAAASFTYFLEKNYVTWSTLDFDANYNITEFENLGSLYGIGGLGVTFASIDLGSYGPVSSSNVGLNLGAGLDVATGKNFAIAPEIRYTISSGGFLRVGVKILFGL